MGFYSAVLRANPSGLKERQVLQGGTSSGQHRRVADDALTLVAGQLSALESLKKRSACYGKGAAHPDQWWKRFSRRAARARLRRRAAV